MRFTKKLLEKPFSELTDEEFRCIGKHFQKHPPKREIKGPLVRCATCRYADISTWMWVCQVNGKWLNPRHTQKTLCTWRRCKDYKPAIQ